MDSKPTVKRDLGKGLEQTRVSDNHWVIEGYDVYPFAHWEGTHTSRGAGIERDGQFVSQVNSLSEARGWIREQTGKGGRQPEPEAGA